jgi:hypothetical protein
MDVRFHQSVCLGAMSYACPSPEMSVADRRQAFADSLLKHAREYHRVAEIDDQGWGTVRLFTRIARGGKTLETLDGWERVVDPPFMRELSTCPESSDFLLSIPAVAYVVEVEIKGGRKCGLAYYIAPRPMTEDCTRAVHVLVFAPVHGVQWRNYDYEPRLVQYTYHRPPSVGKLWCGDEVTVKTGQFTRNFYALSALLYYFMCKQMLNQWEFVFVTPGRQLVALRLSGLQNSCVLELDIPWWKFKKRLRSVASSLEEVMDWAEKVH